MKKPETKKFQRRADARPDEVLDAALDLFITKGFAAARVQDIAAKAGLSKGTVYLYFPSKEAILEALVKRAIVPLVHSAAAAATQEGSDPREVLGTIVSFLSGGLSNPRNAAIPRIILSEAGNFPGLAEMYRREVLDRGLKTLTTVIERGIKSGAFRPVEPASAVKNIIGPILANALMSQVFGLTPPDPETFAKQHLDLLMNGLSAEKEPV